MTDAPRNVPVPDALAAVRAEIKTLETREAELKALILASGIREGQRGSPSQDRDYAAGSPERAARHAR